MSKKRSINLLSSPISQNFKHNVHLHCQHQYGEIAENLIAQQVILILIMITRTGRFVFFVRNRQVKNFGAPLCRKQILSNFMMSLLTE